MPLETQVKLLRVIEAKEITPVGSNQSRKVDVRMVSATNKNLEEQVKKGQFREDLYFRLKVVQVHLPALRERPGDIPLLAQSFAQEFSRQYGKEITGIDHAAINALIAHPWPGNVRELRNTVEEMVVLAQGKLLTAEDLPPNLRAETPATRADAPAGAGVGGLVGMTMAQVEREVIRQSLGSNEGNRERTAKMLEIGERTLYRKIKEYGL
jgi:two-component system response regulator HydG